MQVLFALFLSFLFPPQAEAKPEERWSTMTPYDPFELERWLSAEERNCGQYFEYSGLPTGDRIEVVSFQFGGYSHGVKWKALPTLLMRQLKVYVVEEKNAPKARRIPGENWQGFLYEVEISQEDFDKSPCLMRASHETKK